MRRETRKSRDPDNELENDTTVANLQDLATPTACHKTNLTTSWSQPWVDYIVRATHHKADDLLAASGITSWILKQSQIYWRHAKGTAKHHEDRWTKLVSKRDPAISTKQKGYWKQGRLVKVWQDDIYSHLQPTSPQRQQLCHERHDMAHHGKRWPERRLHGKRFCEHQNQKTITTHD